jgi:hypothetical protein
MALYNIPTHRRGDTWDGISSISISRNDLPFNLADKTAKMQLREDIDSPVVLELSIENGKILYNDNNNSLQIPPQIINILPGTYKYDLQVTSFDGTFNKTYIEGSWTIIADITE